MHSNISYWCPRRRPCHILIACVCFEIWLAWWLRYIYWVQVKWWGVSDVIFDGHCSVLGWSVISFAMKVQWWTGRQAHDLSLCHHLRCRWDLDSFHLAHHDQAFHLDYRDLQWHYIFFVSLHTNLHSAWFILYRDELIGLIWTNK